MATGKTIIPADLTPQVWSKVVWAEARKKIFFDKFAGPEIPSTDKTSQSSFNNIVVTATDLTKTFGDTMHIGLVKQLSGEGVKGATPMEDAEEKIDFYHFSVVLERYRNATIFDTVYEGQKSPYDLGKVSKDLLADWLSSLIDDLTITALTTTPTPNRVLYGGDATGDDTLEPADVFSTTLIEKAVRKAKMAVPKIRPVKVKGKDYYVILAHPYQIKALRTENDWQEAQQAANVRGDENPIFSGAEGIWGGAVIHEYERIPSYDTDDGWGVAGARAVLLGAQAVVHLFGNKVYWKEREEDYDSKGTMVGTIVGIAKTVFPVGVGSTNEDYATIALDTAIAVD